VSCVLLLVKPELSGTRDIHYNSFSFSTVSLLDHSKTLNTILDPFLSSIQFAVIMHMSTFVDYWTLSITMPKCLLMDIVDPRFRPAAIALMQPEQPVLSGA
jgi:hypothetical protein